MKQSAVAPQSRRPIGCQAQNCLEVATIRVETLDTGELTLCPIHWLEMRRRMQTALQVLRQLGRPTCFKADCTAGAVSVMPHLDERPLPVCEKHLEDLSWVTPLPEELAALEPSS
jgi:hypothetical protein